jgi:heme-degrading monooxygenase HmoA
MFAVVRERTPGTGVENEHLEEFRRVRAQQPGYRGIVEVADDDGRILILALWDSEDQYRAARATIDEAGSRLGGSHWSGPPRAIGQGRVVYNDLTPD